MKKLLVALVVVLAASATLVTPALAGSSTDAALALGAFAVFNQLATGQTVFHRAFAPPAVVVPAPPPVVHVPRPRVYVPAPRVPVYPRAYRYVIPGYYHHPGAYYRGHRGHWTHGRAHDRGRDHFRGHEDHHRRDR